MIVSYLITGAGERIGEKYVQDREGESARIRDISATCLESRVLQRGSPTRGKTARAERDDEKDTRKQDSGAMDSTEAWSGPVARRPEIKGAGGTHPLWKVPPKTRISQLAPTEPHP